MNKETLDQTHPSYDAERWSELEALAEGGKKFHALIDRFLPQNPMEPDLRYAVRKKRARYYSYTGAIINLYTSWLFAAGFDAKPYKRGSSVPLESVSPFYGMFQENVGNETTLKAFMKDRFREAMKVGKSIWLVEKPPVPDGVQVDDQATYEQLGLDRVKLTARSACDLLDWEEDDDGELIWAVLKSTWIERPSPAVKRNQVVEQWRIYTRDDVTTYELRYEKGRPPSPKTEVPQKGEPTLHGFKRVPIIRLCIPEEMCVGEQTYDAQVAHFQLDNALSWAITATCYPVPVFKLADEDKKPVMGIGYAIFLGENESLEYTSPPGESFDTIARNRDSKRDEIFRIVHQMAQGLDNNAETVGRSAESKEIDAAATRIMLNAYGEIVGHAIEETYELISEARGDEEYEWSVEGFSGYDTATAGTLLANIKLAKSLGVPSNTFMREISKKGALALVPELDPRVKETIREEIDKYDFTPSGELLEQQMLREELDSNEKNTESTLKSQEKTTALSAKAKANQPKPKQ